jgi:hypothetical protein
MSEAIFVFMAAATGLAVSMLLSVLFHIHISPIITGLTITAIGFIFFKDLIRKYL